ncbi:hypothetical protein MYU51_016781 [Penicillium brevicompactum]
MGTAKPPEVREAEVGNLNHGTAHIVELVSLSLDHLRDTWGCSKVSRVSTSLCHWFDRDQSTVQSIQEPAYIDLKSFLSQAPRICLGFPRSGIEADMYLSPSDVRMKSTESEKEPPQAEWDIEEREPEKKRSGVLNVVVSGLP